MNPASDSNAFQVGEAAQPAATSVPAFTISQLIDQLGVERVDLIKMDVEGAEAEILREGRDWIDRTRVLVIELHDRLVPGCAESLAERLRGRRYRQEIVGQNLAISFA